MKGEEERWNDDEEDVEIERCLFQSDRESRLMIHNQNTSEKQKGSNDAEDMESFGRWFEDGTSMIQKKMKTLNMKEDRMNDGHK
jgi:hypothetical protein